MNTHIYFLLDRTGSMESMKADVIGGFNTFLAEQQADGADARMTLVQFDTADPFEVLTDGAPIAKVRPLTESTFQPRGGTPLWDATAKTVLHTSARVARRAEKGKADEQVLVVTFTDGEENASKLFAKHDVLELVEAKKAVGWTFAFLGAGIDAYDEGGRMGYAGGSVQAFAADGTGSREAFASLSRSTRSMRGRGRRDEISAPDQFFEDKDAEADLARRSS